VAEFLAQLLDTDPVTIFILGGATIFTLAMFAAVAGRVIMTIGIVVLGALVLILPNGALLIAGIVVLGVVYMLTKSGVGAVSVSITKGDGDGDINVNL